MVMSQTKEIITNRLRNVARGRVGVANKSARGTSFNQPYNEGDKGVILKKPYLGLAHEVDPSRRLLLVMLDTDRELHSVVLECL